MQTADQIIKAIELRKNKGLGLPHFKTYMKTLGNPQDKLSCIHVAGTNGKGSTVNYLRSILQAAGYRVGTFTSPYLETHLDRIRINDVFIDEETFAKISNHNFDAWLEYDLNMFEIDMVIACLYFLQENCDICIFEVGLGGRLDATNILHPIVSAITNIGMDHMDRLGDTYEKIATEKAGIIKDKIPLVTGEDKASCLEVFQTICEQHQTKLYQVTDIHQCVYALDHITFDFQSYQGLKISSGARYQIKNAKLALEILSLLQNTYQIEEEHIRIGLEQAVWKGRFEIMHQDPLILVDGAHNVEGILALKESLRDFSHVKILFAALKDKDSHDMLKHLLEITDDVVVTEFDFYRVKPAVELAESFPVKIEYDYKKIIEDVLKTPETSLVITGSLYFISEVREFLKRT